MSYRLIKQIGVITAANLADDSEHSTSAFTIGINSSIRVSEFGGNDVFVKISNEGTVVTNSSGVSNGTYLKAGTSIVIVPDDKPKSAKVLSATSANPAVLTVTDHFTFAAGDQVSLLGASVGAWNTLITDANIASIGGSEGPGGAGTETTITTDKNSASTAAFTYGAGGTLISCFKLSCINETAGSDGAIYIEEVVIAHAGV